LLGAVTGQEVRDHCERGAHPACRFELTRRSRSRP